MKVSYFAKNIPGDFPWVCKLRSAEICLGAVMSDSWVLISYILIESLCLKQFYQCYKAVPCAGYSLLAFLTHLFHAFLCCSEP